MSDPSKLASLPADDWDATLESVLADMHGRPLNIHKLLANNPLLLHAWWPLRMYIVTGGSLGSRNAELVVLRTAVQRASWYEWASHVVRGLSCELSMAEIERVVAGPSADGWELQDAALLTAVDELELDGAIKPATVESLGLYFDQQNVLDLIAIHATYVMLGMILTTWPVSLDEHVSAALPQAVTEHQFAAALKNRRRS